MPAVVTGSKTVTKCLAPHLQPATLTALLAIAPENMTVAQLDQIQDALSRVPYGDTSNSIIGSLLT